MEEHAKNENNELPIGVRGWSWGAFFLTWIWGIPNRVWLSLLAWIPVVNIFVAIVLGFKGREWAWKAKNWSDLDKFNKYQSGWNKAGWITFVLIVFAFILYPQYRKYEQIKSNGVHYYDYKNGDTYGHEAKPSAVDLKHGKLAKRLILAKLLEDNNGSYSISIFRAVGSDNYAVFSCKSPCHYATEKNYDNGRLLSGGVWPVKHRTIIWEVLKDAMNGKLTVSDNPGVNFTSR